MKELYSDEEIIGMCEAYQMYQILPEDAQKKIPQEFVNEMEKCAKYNVGATINGPVDITAERLSREGVKRMAYMCLFLK